MSKQFNPRRFHEREDIGLQLPSVTDRQQISEHLEAVGCVVDYDSDYAYLPRVPNSAPWQSSDVTQIDFFLDGKPSDYPNSVDRLTFIYLLATLPEDTIPIFISTIESCVLKFGGKLDHRGRPFGRAELHAVFRGYVAELRDELADEPGSEFVAKMLYEFRPRG